MSVDKKIRLSKLARKFNVGTQTIAEFLCKNGFDINSNPNAKVHVRAIQLLEKEFKTDVSIKAESKKISLNNQQFEKDIIPFDNSDDIGKELNLEEKYEIIEEIKALTNSDGAINETFIEFRIILLQGPYLPCLPVKQK